MQTSNLHSSDLRIGNLLLYENRIIKVIGLNKGWIEYYNEEFDKCGDKPKYFHPIELTEEVLLKIGFKKNTIYGSVIEYLPMDNDLASVFCTKEKQNVRIQIVRKNASETIVKYIKYLHQLQNAYYLLTGQEWEVSL